MLNNQRKCAIDLLMCHPETLVAEMLGIKTSTLRSWMCDSEFSDALRERDNGQRTSLLRLARQSALFAAASLCQSASEPGKLDLKIAVELMKLSGAFEKEEISEMDALSEIIKMAAKTDESGVMDE